MVAVIMMHIHQRLYSYDHYYVGAGNVRKLSKNPLASQEVSVSALSECHALGLQDVLFSLDGAFWSSFGAQSTQGIPSLRMVSSGFCFGILIGILSFLSTSLLCF